jgi:hypothetical protein
MSPSFFRKRLEFCFDKHNTKANYRALYSSDFDDQGENNLICPENTFSKNEMMTRSMLKTQAGLVHVFGGDPISADKTAMFSWKIDKLNSEKFKIKT